MSGDTRNGLCDLCEKRRRVHLADDEGLKKLCPDGSGNTFKWKATPGRFSISMNAEEAKAFDISIAQAMGGSERISKTNPHLVTLRRKSMRMRKKAMA